MLAGLQTAPLYAHLLGDAEVAALLSADAHLAAMVRVEAALALAEAEVGVIPDDAGRRLAAALPRITLDRDDLARGIGAAGVAVPALVAQVRGALPPDLAHWVHWGATSQDIADTGAMLQAKTCLEALAARLASVIDALQAAADAHAEVVMAGRTRGQIAAPITAGLRIAQWAQPLIRAEAALPALRRDALRVQFGGAVGANTAVAPEGPRIATAMARILGLTDAPPWHGDRSGVQALGVWLTQTTAALARIGRDLALTARGEIGEMRGGTAGGSSTMPQKANPVQAEALAALGTAAAAYQAGLAAAASPVEERDGPAWMTEWLFLPPLFLAAGAALRHAAEVIATLSVDGDRMAVTLAANPGAMAEAASFALARTLPRADAQALVKRALADDRPFPDALAALTDAAVDWLAELDPARVVAPCRAVADAIFALRARKTG